MTELPDSCDVAIVGAGAAGLATAIFARRASPSLSVMLFDRAATPGATILVSGGRRGHATHPLVAATPPRGGNPPRPRPRHPPSTLPQHARLLLTSGAPPRD